MQFIAGLCWFIWADILLPSSTAWYTCIIQVFFTSKEFMSDNLDQFIKDGLHHGHILCYKVTNDTFHTFSFSSSLCHVIDQLLPNACTISISILASTCSLVLWNPNKCSTKNIYKFRYALDLTTLLLIFVKKMGNVNSLIIAAL